MGWPHLYKCQQPTQPSRSVSSPVVLTQCSTASAHHTVLGHSPRALALLSGGGQRDTHRPIWHLSGNARDASHTTLSSWRSGLIFQAASEKEEAGAEKLQDSWCSLRVRRLWPQDPASPGHAFPSPASSPSRHALLRQPDLEQAWASMRASPRCGRLISLLI